MKLPEGIEVPTYDQLIAGCEQYEKHEKRDSMYKVATFLLNHFWGNPAEMADALGVLLLTWNQAFYKFGVFDFDKLEESISKNLKVIDGFRARNILSLSEKDEEQIKKLFNDFYVSLQIDSGNQMKGRKSPVAVAKALHLLAPGFLPLWDKKIAVAYKLDYSKEPDEKYFRLCLITKYMSEKIIDYEISSEKTIVKMIDEYNYSKYTQKWI